MNLILLQDNDFIAPDKVRLSDHRFQQITAIHKSGVGDSVKVGKLNGLMGQGIITAIDESSVELTTTLDSPPPSKLPLTIILALPRPKMLRRIFRSVVELGVAELIIINSYKVEKSFWNSPALNEEKVQGYLIDGLQQAKDTVPPKISFHRLFKPFVEDQLPAIIAGKNALVAHPGSGETVHRSDGDTVLAIGPEGGFTPYEVDKFIEQGFSPLDLGPRILRVENAVSAITGKLFL